MAARAVCLRLTPREGTEDEARFKVGLTKLEGSYLVVREYASSMHLHALAWTTKTMVQARSVFAHALGKTGNGVFSMKVSHDPKAWLQYICKGDRSHPDPRGDVPEVVFREGLWTSDDAVKAAYDAYWEQSAKCKETLGVSFANQVMFYMGTNQVEYSKENVLRVVVDHAMMHKQQLNDYYIVGVAKMVLAKNNRTFKQEYIASLLRKFDACSTDYTAQAEHSWSAPQRCGCPRCDSLGEGSGACCAES